ncbi:MAG TPA: metal transporter, partial [Afifellaceae bacterium]|nr:metal transporter [Afifellaceae bacterium]
ERPSLLHFTALTALAGLPAVAGVFFGSNVVSPFWTALCFGVGAGAIIQVVIEISALLARWSGAGELISPSSLGGVVAGLAVMYSTALLV